MRCTAVPYAAGLAVVALLSACTGGGSATSESPPALSEPTDLPLAPAAQRVDTGEPTFSDPTSVTNPLFPIADLHSAVLLGAIDGQRFRTETTLLPETKTIEWKGQPIETLVSQYVAYLDGRLEEVALDWYAQADDGAVWYLGEDVYNYVDGELADRDGTWITGVDAPPAMIMPGSPTVGDTYRPENAFPIVFEEVTVKAVDQVVEGPRGPVPGAITVRELHMEGTTEDKVFAPGYGEFSTGTGGDLEALALAVPTDALASAVPAELTALLAAALTVYDAAGGDDWGSVRAAQASAEAAWSAYRAGGVPPLMDDLMTRALRRLSGDHLAPAIAAENAGGAQKGALDVAQATLDLQLRHRTPAEVDLRRLDLWSRQLVLDAAAQEPGAIQGDVTTLGWIRDRFAHTLSSTDAAQIDTWLDQMRGGVESEDLQEVENANGELRLWLADRTGG